MPTFFFLCAQLLVPAGSSNYTVYLRSYNSINNTISAKSTQHVVASGATFNPNDLCPDEIPAVAEDEEEDEEEEEGEGGGESAKVVASMVPGIIQVSCGFLFVTTSYMCSNDQQKPIAR